MTRACLVAGLGLWLLTLTGTEPPVRSDTTAGARSRGADLNNPNPEGLQKLAEQSAKPKEMRIVGPDGKEDEQIRRFKVRAEDLKDPDPKVRQFAVDELARRGTTGMMRLAQDLIKALEDPDAGVRAAAAKALGELGPSVWAHTVPRLAQALKDEDEQVRVRAANALVHIGPFAYGAVPALIEAASDKSVLVRRRAVTALGMIGPRAKTAVPVLIQALKDKDVAKDRSEVSVSVSATISLGHIGPGAKAAIPALVAVATNKEGNVLLRSEAAGALGEIGNENEIVIPALIELLRDAQIGGAAAVALGRIGPEAKKAVPVLIELLKAKKVLETQEDYGLVMTAIDALGAIGPDAETALPVLLDVVRNKTPTKNADFNHSVHRDALRAIGKLGPLAKTAAPTLIEVLNDSQRRSLAEEVSEALAKIGPDAVPALLEILKKDNLKQKPGLPWLHAIRALGHMGPAAKEAVPVLTQIVNNPDPYVQGFIRVHAQEALNKIGK